MDSDKKTLRLILAAGHTIEECAKALGRILDKVSFYVRQHPLLEAIPRTIPEWTYYYERKLKEGLW